MRNNRTSRGHFRLLVVLTLVTGILCSNLSISSSAGSKLQPDNASAHDQNATSPDSPLNSLDTYEGGESTLSGINETALKAPSNTVCNASNDACIWEDNSTPGPLGCRIPLLFIHGIHGNQIEKVDDPRLAPNTSYFGSLIGQLTSSSKAALDTNYKIYRFHYKSDVNSVQTIGLDLGRLLDKLISDEPNFDKEFMIVAHSMGGLVARAYMNLYRHHSGGSGSRFAGKPAGDRVLKLITLGTPHHGSQLSNGLARTQDSFLGTPWSAVFRSIDAAAWGSLACVTYLSSCLAKPNRSDLHWDDYNGVWNKRSGYRNNPAEQNSLLRSLTSTTYDNKIYPYFGYIGDGKISGRHGDVIDFGKASPASLALTLALNQHYPYQHRGLVAAGVVLERIDEDNFAFGSLIGAVGIPNLFNDGFVTFQSASFSGRSDRTKLRTCLGYDHLDMRDGAPFNCRAGSVEKPLVQFLIDDLSLASRPACPRVVVSTSLRLSPNTGPYSVGQTLGGTFSLTNRGNANVVMNKVLISGRVGDICPNNVCPDFTPTFSNITLAPGKSYNYSGKFTPGQNGTYKLSVAYQKPDGSWVNPVDSENGTINKLSITVQSPAARAVVSTSLRLSPNSGPYSTGQSLGGTFSITNRGNANLVMSRTTISVRADTCPNGVCQDSTPIPSNITVAPGQTYNYSGIFKLPQKGIYTFTVAYQKPDGSWVLPVATENGTINRLSLTVQGPGPTLTGTSPASIMASPTAQIIYVNGARLTKTLYGSLRLPNGTVTNLYVPLSQVTNVADDRLKIKFKFATRGTYYLSTWTKEGQSNQLTIVVN